MFGPKGDTGEHNLFAVIDQQQEKRHTPASQSPEGCLGCCVAAFNQHFFQAIGRIF